ncbi:MAG: T9SS type A sorting domain-containing protein [Candidatus Kapabacteria bacterium]|nr:T9SS type A sorting domain-containing protein [Ignavibacteriota bacterium]MCW5883865.1 T9SS type A sorting domain-containing protein [Candidatus Kapabacteria bacterium]
MLYNYKLKIFKSLVFLIVLFISIGSSYSTDLTIGRVLLPDSVFAGIEFKIRLELANINILSAENYDIKTYIQDSFGNLEYSYETKGPRIDPFSEIILELDKMPKLSLAGTYKITTLVDFIDDIDRSNDTMPVFFNVYDRPNEQPQLKFNYFAHVYEYPLGMPDYGYGSLRISYPPFDKNKFFNVFTSMDTSGTSEPEWIVQNSILPKREDSTSFDIHIDLSWYPDKTYKSKFFTYFTVADTSIIDYNDYDFDWAEIELLIDTLNISTGVLGLNDTILNSSINFTPSTPTSAPIESLVYRGCTIPNIDLDSSAHRAGSTPGYAGDWNACAPASAANSMQWLEKIEPKINSKLSHREKLEDLSKLMGRPDNEGVYIREFIEGKLAFINKHKLPIRVKFQVKNLNEDVDSPDKISNDAINKGNGSAPSWDFLLQEMKDDEDVELFLEYHKKFGNQDIITGRHAVTLSGMSEGGGKKQLWYKDDLNQNKPGGMREPKNEWQVLEDGTPILNEPFVVNDTTFYTTIFAGVSESYDSTVVFKEKGYLERGYDGIKKLGRWLWNEEIVEAGNPNPEYINIVGKETPSSHPKWILRNYPLYPLESDTLRFAYFDLSNFTNAFNDLVDSIQFKIIYSDNTIQQMPMVDENDWFYYSFETNNTLPDESSIDNSAPILNIDLSSNLFPDYISTTPEISDSIFISDFSTYIDLDNSSYNSNTVQNYLGDANASGLSSLAGILKLIEKNHSQIQLGMDSREILYSLSRKSNRENNKGLNRESLLQSCLLFLEDKQLPISIHFQSLRKATENVFSGGIFNNSAENMTPANGIPDWKWIFSKMSDENRFSIVELAWYDHNGRKYGTWATITGLIEQNGVRLIRIFKDWNANETNGLASSFLTLNKTDEDHLYIVELSDIESKCIIESFVTVAYDPTVIYTDVKDNLSRNEYELKIIPNPGHGNQSINIEVNVKQFSLNEIALYSLLGEKLEVIYEGELSGQKQIINWNPASRYPAGVYLIRLKGASNSISTVFVIE